MSTEEKIDYGKIKNLNPEYKHIDRIGDYGIDQDGNRFCFTESGWEPIHPYQYESRYWKKKYFELANMKNIL